MTLDLGEISEARHLRWLGPEEPRPFMAFHGRELQGCVIRYKPTGNPDCEWFYAEIAHVEKQNFLLIPDDPQPWVRVININAKNNRIHQLQFVNEFPNVPVNFIMEF